MGGPGSSGRDGGDNLRTAVTLLPTPDASMGPRGCASQAQLDRGYHAVTLNDLQRLMPTPSATPYGNNQNASAEAAVRPSLSYLTDWGSFEPAIRRWETLTRPAPAPTETGPKGGQRLAPRFVEWMMGLPEGHVTDPAIGLTRNNQLKALGNGVCPQQAEAAIRALLNNGR